MRKPRTKIGAVDLFLIQLLLAAALVSMYLLWVILRDEIHLALQPAVICFSVGGLGFLATAICLRVAFHVQLWLALLVGLVIWYLITLLLIEFLYGIPLVKWLLG